ncbi:hypothetical protein BJY00DRAFT_257324 [Aspergillus carlsbadensis]|nr:hypothetical protein BJY00DRAFT_257324 [Aspergillus carlsbadensis]
MVTWVKCGEGQITHARVARVAQHMIFYRYLMLMAVTLLCRPSRPSRVARKLVCHVLQSQRLRRLSESTDSSTLSPEAHRKPGPVQIDFLRFALTRALRPRYGENSDSNIEGLFKYSFLEEWETSAIPIPLWNRRTVEGISSPENATFQLKHVRNIRDIQRIIEQNMDNKTVRFLLTDGFDDFSLALKQTQRLSTLGEILSFINMLEIRVNQSGPPILSQLHILGMQYACLAFCERALEYHLRSYLSITHESLNLKQSVSLVGSLQSSVRFMSFQHPDRDVSKMRSLIKGSPGSQTPGLHGILCWTDRKKASKEIGAYMALLVQIRDGTLHQELWDEHLEGTTPSSSPWHFASAYQYALALASSGKISAALIALEKLSKRAGNSLPYFVNFQGLHDILQHDTISRSILSLVNDIDQLKILEDQLQRIEDRLGIKWQARNERHIGGFGPPEIVASEQPIFTMDGDSPGYESNERLVAEIKALGCSRFAADLNKVADLLDDYEGDLVRVYIPTWDAPDAEFYWAPQRAPIDFFETYAAESIDDKETQLAQGLGLIKVAPPDNELFLQHSLPLMQLGYLFRKPKPSSDGHDGDAHELEKTGYIVAFDRLGGCFRVVFAKDCAEPIEYATEFQELVTAAGTDAIAQMYPLVEVNSVNRLEEFSIPRYRIELDTNPNLVHDRLPGPLRPQWLPGGIRGLGN